MQTLVGSQATVCVSLLHYFVWFFNLLQCQKTWHMLLQI